MNLTVTFIDYSTMNVAIKSLVMLGVKFFLLVLALFSCFASKLWTLERFSIFCVTDQ